MIARWHDARVLVTGATGFLGRHLCAALEHNGAVVEGFSRSTNRAGVEDASALAATFERSRPSHVFHLAGEPIAGSGLSPFSVLTPNVVGTMNVLESAARSGVQAVVVASTAIVYGDAGEAPHREDEGLMPTESYAVSKACADMIARLYHRQAGLPVVVLRLANLYGPGDPHASRLIPGAVTALLAGERPVLRGDGSEVRDYLFVNDAVDGLLAAGLSAGRSDVAGKAFNVGTGHGFSSLEVLADLAEVSGCSGLPPVIGSGAGRRSQILIDVSRAAATLGWTAATPLPQGLAATWTWAQAQRTAS